MRRNAKQILRLHPPSHHYLSQYCGPDVELVNGFLSQATPTTISPRVVSVKCPTTVFQLDALAWLVALDHHHHRLLTQDLALR